MEHYLFTISWENLKLETTSVDPETLMGMSSLKERLCLDDKTANKNTHYGKVVFSCKPKTEPLQLKLQSEKQTR